MSTRSSLKSRQTLSDDFTPYDNSNPRVSKCEQQRTWKRFFLVYELKDANVIGRNKDWMIASKIHLNLCNIIGIYQLVFESLKCQRLKIMLIFIVHCGLCSKDLGISTCLCHLYELIAMYYVVEMIAII